MGSYAREYPNEDLNRLGSYVKGEFDALADKTHLSLMELMEIIEEVNIDKLHEAAQQALHRISYAVDLTPEQIYAVFTQHRGAGLDDVVRRLHEKSSENRAKF